MRISGWLLASSALLLVAGCNNREAAPKTEATPGKASPDSKMANPPDLTPPADTPGAAGPGATSAPSTPNGASATTPNAAMTPNPTNPPKPNASTAPAPTPPATKFIPGIFTPEKQGANGWVQTSVPDLGTRIDSALSKLTETRAEAALGYESAGNTLDSKTVLEIRDNTKFRYEYYLPTTMAAHNVVISDGKTVLREEKYKRTIVQPGQSETSADKWIKNFPRSILDGFATRSDEWTKFIKAVQAPDSGYQTVTETKTTMASGKPQTFIRLLAKKDNPKTEFEARINTNMDLPVTVRLDSIGSDGKPYRMIWTCVWEKGGKFNEKDFTLPAEAKKS